MKKQLFICALFVICQFTMHAQKLETVLNVGPRVGDVIVVSCEYKDGENLKGSMSFTCERTTKPGPYQVGPFAAWIDGKMYKTDSVVINISPALPDVKEGAWVRVIEQDGKIYVTVEQKSSSLKEEKDYISLNKEAFTNEGIELHRVERMFVTFGSGKLTLIYELRKKDTFKQFQLSSAYFVNLPTGTDLKNLWVK